jgi:lipoteichoic acid synthase
VLVGGQPRPINPVYLDGDHAPITSLGYSAADLLRSRIEVAWYNDLSHNNFPTTVPVDLTETYPIQRHKGILPTLPFSRTQDTHIPLNVIVIFAEGFSSRLMSVYDGPYLDLTPNLDAFADNTMIVDNYYNHTAATFRGLLGQIASAYPYYGGNMRGGWAEKGLDNTETLTNINYQTLSRVLLDRNYDTMFFSPHPDSNSLNTMLRALDFETVYNLEAMEGLLGSPISPHSGAVEDRDLFNGLQTMLEDRARNGQTKPFFAATYNIGTHAFLDVSDRGKRYGDGQNQALNRFHEFDAAIGPFLDYFIASSYSQNTLLVFTTDHASYHEPPVVEAFDAPDFYRFFVDEIPLLIYAPHLHLPKRYDARYENSIDLTPSILHLMNIENYQHSFLGQSIFQLSRLDGFSLASIGVVDYIINSGGIYRLTAENITNQIQPYQNLVKFFQFLETKNRVFSQN